MLTVPARGSGRLTDILKEVLDIIRICMGQAEF